jgi:uncharacterized protein (DUF58 family)
MPSVLDPKLLAATRGLTLAARQLVAGVLHGLHASRQPGVAREFSQFRAYQPGDEPRHIDWKLFARSDRHYVRESEIDTAVTVRLILDATASMRHADTTGPGEGLRKFDVARLLAVALAFLAQAQGDRASLHAIVDGRIVSVPPGGQRQPLERIIRTLETLEPAGRWPVDGRALSSAIAAGTPQGLGLAMAREIVVVLTDGHEHDREIRGSVGPLRTRGHELVLFHLVGRDEIDFPFRGPVRFEDWETGETFETDAGAARAAWLEGQARLVSEWRRDWKGDGRFEYARFRLDEPPDRALRAYLRQRQGTSPGSRR